MAYTTWYRPPDNRWHAFKKTSAEPLHADSLCDNWRAGLAALLRTGRDTMGPGAYCTSCKKAAQRIAKERAHG